MGNFFKIFFCNSDEAVKHCVSKMLTTVVVKGIKVNSEGAIEPGDQNLSLIGYSLSLSEGEMKKYLAYLGSDYYLSHCNTGGGDRILVPICKDQGAADWSTFYT